MRNQYAGICYRCGWPVAAGAGYFEKVRREDRKPGDSAWRVQHCYRTHNGGETCDMAVAKGIAEERKRQKAEVEQFGCVR